MPKLGFEKVGGKLRPEWQPSTAYSDSLTKNLKPRKENIPWDFGWIPPFVRTEKQADSDHRALQGMPRFAIKGKQREESVVRLFDLWSHADVVAALGFKYPGTHQLTGSCVGASGGNVHFALSAWEALRLGDPERLVVPHWLFTYGRSRYHCGMKGPGEGSLGSCYAKAAMEDGIVPSDAGGLPKFDNSDGLVWGASTEMKWSAGDRAPCTDWLSKARVHLVKTTARCRNHEDVRQAILNGYPCTAASMYAHDGGKVQGNPPVSIGRRRGSWSHQMSYQAFWEHPQFGLLFWEPNQWGMRAHTVDPSVGHLLGTGVWVLPADVDYTCRDEVFAFSQFDGFPAQTFNWST